MRLRDIENALIKSGQQHKYNIMILHKIILEENTELLRLVIFCIQFLKCFAV